MTAFLTIIVLLLVFIAIWQMTKIFELSQVASQNSQVANDKDNHLNGQLMFAFLIFIYLITIFSFWKWGDILLGKSASEHGPEYDSLMEVSMILIFFVQIVTQALLHYFAFKYRGKKENKALFYADNDRLEFIWTIIPVIVLAGLILWGLYTWTNIMDVNEEEGDPIIVELYAQQFNWKARYAGNDNTLGESNVRLIDIDKNNVLGLDEADPNGKDDVISFTELHLPVNRKVVFKMRSQDVLHSAYMPHFRAQMNCVPGMITQFAFTPTVTTVEMRQDAKIAQKVTKINKLRADRKTKGEDVEPWEFDYILLCNKICGSSHYNMQMKIIVETEEEFNAWMKEQQTFGQTMASKE